jgi:hypothetical protein
MALIIQQLYVKITYNCCIISAMTAHATNSKITYNCHIISAMTAHATNSKITYNCH